MTRDEILRENKRGGGMFAVIPSVVMLDEELPASAKLLYGVITWRSGKYGFCWATNEVLGADVGISGKRVSPLITLLENRGHIETELLLNTALSGGKQRNIYPVVKSARGLAGGMLKNEDTLSSKMRRGSPQKRGDGILKNEEQKKKNKYINIPHIVPHDVADVLLDYCGEDEQLLSALCGLLENRAKVNRSKTVMTTRAMNGILGQLDRLSEGDRAMKLALLEQAITSNWLTVYELKPDKRPRASGGGWAEDTEVI